MPKRVAFKDFVSVSGVDLSDLARKVEFSSENARVDVSGFNATGSSEFLAGVTTQTVTVEFYGSYGSGEVHQTLYPAHAARSIVPFQWRPDQTSPVSATNPELVGNVQILTYKPGGERGNADTYSVEFTAADAAGLTFTSTPPVAATGATAGTPGTFTPSGATTPANLAALTGITASPSSAWTTGQYVLLADASHAHWSSSAWVAGNA